MKSIWASLLHVMFILRSSSSYHGKWPIKRVTGAAFPSHYSSFVFDKIALYDHFIFCWQLSCSSNLPVIFTSVGMSQFITALLMTLVTFQNGKMYLHLLFQYYSRVETMYFDCDWSGPINMFYYRENQPQILDMLWWDSGPNVQFCSQYELGQLFTQHLRLDYSDDGPNIENKKHKYLNTRWILSQSTYKYL